MTQIGPDFASVDDNENIDFPAAKRAGARFAIVRAIYGRHIDGENLGPFRDPCWANDKDAIKAAGLRRGAYLFLCYDKPGVHTPSPEDQAQAFIDYVQLDPFQDFAPIFDVEELSPTMDPDAMYQWSLRCAQKLRDHYGVWPMMYTSARVWAENLGHHSPGPLLNCPLWLAKPWPWLTLTPVHLDGATAYSPTTIPEFGDQYFVYQYQGDAIKWPGFSSTVDANRMRVFGEGSKGAHVVWTQHRLAIPSDGIFGPMTKAAVVSLQKKHGLYPDGIVGVDTFAALCWSCPA